MKYRLFVLTAILLIVYCLCGCSSSEDVSVSETSVPAPTANSFTFTVYDPNASETEETEYVAPERSVPDEDDFDKFGFEDDNTCILPGTNIMFTMPDGYEFLDESDRMYSDLNGDDTERRFLFGAEDDDVGCIYVIYMGPYNFMNTGLQESASDVIDRFNEQHLENGGYTNVYTVSFEMDGRECEAYGVLALYYDYPEFTQLAFLVGDHDTAYYVYCQSATQDEAEAFITRFVQQDQL